LTTGKIFIFAESNDGDDAQSESLSVFHNCRVVILWVFPQVPIFGYAEVFEGTARISWGNNGDRKSKHTNSIPPPLMYIIVRESALNGMVLLSNIELMASIS
jgi:hypothetical protein